MNRIFAPLALFAVVLALATFCLGFSLRLGDVRDPRDRTAQQWATVHRLSGISAGLVIVLVNSVVVTYFIGTSRWCKEVAETYCLDPEYIRRSNYLKRRTFPVAVAGMLLAVGIVGLGGAADPAASLQLQPLAGLTWRDIHLMFAATAILLIGGAFLIQANNIRANQDIIRRVLEEVKRIRAERGLD